MSRRTRARIDLQAMHRLSELADYVVPFTLRAICQLGVADALADGPLHIEDLARATGTHPQALLRALRTLASKEIFEEVRDETFGLTPISDLLLSDHPHSMGSAYPLLPATVAAWAHMDQAIRTDGSAFEHVHHQSLWSYFATHPEAGRAFDGTQEAQTRLELLLAARVYPWSELGTVVDVGGGNGSFLAGLLRRTPGLRGVLVDLPHVLEQAPAVLERAEVTDRVTLVAGDFFEPLPEIGDAYVLKRILYGWKDDEALAILRNLRRAIPEHGRLLVLEPIAGSEGDAAMSPRYDMLMLTMLGTRARSRDELERLFERSGFALTRVFPTLLFPLIEAIPE